MLTDRVADRYLSESQQGRLREILAALHEDHQGAFVAALWKPPIDQGHLFRTYGVKPPDREQVGRIARTLLLDRPSLAGSPEHLGSLVERELVRYLKNASERVLARYMSAAE